MGMHVRIKDFKIKKKKKERYQDRLKFQSSLITSVYTKASVIKFDHTISMSGYPVNELPVSPADSNVVVFI